MNNILASKQGRHAAPKRLYPHGTSNYPVRHSSSAECDILQLPVLLLPVKRRPHLIFLLNNIRNSTGTRHALFDNGHRHFGGNYVSAEIIFFTGFALVFLPVIVDYGNLCRDNIQLAADKFFANADHLFAAFGAALAIKINNHLLMLYTFGELFSGEPFLPCAGLACDGFGCRFGRTC